MHKKLGSGETYITTHVTITLHSKTSGNMNRSLNLHRSLYRLRLHCRRRSTRHREQRRSRLVHFADFLDQVAVKVLAYCACISTSGDIDSPNRQIQSILFSPKNTNNLLSPSTVIFQVFCDQLSTQLFTASVDFLGATVEIADPGVTGAISFVCR